MQVFLSIIFGYFTMISQTPPLNLDKYRWENRIVLLFANVAESKYKSQSEELLNDESGLKDRDLLIFHIDQNSKITELMNSVIYESKTNLRSDFNVPKNDFYVLLIGKDGTVKFRDDNPISRTKLYAIIDAMPMRQAEMRRKN